MKSKIPSRYKKFAREFVKDCNAKQAAIRAGYSKKTAKQKGSQLLTIIDVQEEIAKLAKKGTEKAEVEIVDILTGIKNCAYFDPIDMWETKDFGTAKLMKIKSLADIPVEVRKAIIGMDVETTQNAVGQLVTKIKLRFESRLKALELLGKYKTMFTERLELSGEFDILVEYTDD